MSESFYKRVMNERRKEIYNKYKLIEAHEVYKKYIQNELEILRLKERAVLLNNRLLFSFCHKMYSGIMANYFFFVLILKLH